MEVQLNLRDCDTRLGCERHGAPSAPHSAQPRARTQLDTAISTTPSVGLGSHLAAPVVERSDRNERSSAGRCETLLTTQRPP